MAKEEEDDGRRGGEVEENWEDERERMAKEEEYDGRMGEWERR